MTFHFVNSPHPLLLVPVTTIVFQFVTPVKVLNKLFFSLIVLLLALLFNSSSLFLFSFTVTFSHSSFLLLLLLTYNLPNYNFPEI